MTMNRTRMTIFLAAALLLCVSLPAMAQYGVGNTPGLEFRDPGEEIKTYPPVERCHLVGISYNVGFGGLYVTPTQETHREFTPVGFGISYTYLHDLWGIYSYFGLQAGVRYEKEGFSYQRKDNTTYNKTFYDVIEVPLTALFHYEILNKHVRLMVNAGPYVGYRLNVDRPYMEDQGIPADQWQPSDIRFDYGIKAGGGFALVFAPVEIHFEAFYKHSFSYLYQPNRDSQYYYSFAYPSQVLVSVGLHFQFGRKFIQSGN